MEQLSHSYHHADEGEVRFVNVGVFEGGLRILERLGAAIPPNTIVEGGTFAPVARDLYHLRDCTPSSVCGFYRLRDAKFEHVAEVGTNGTPLAD